MRRREFILALGGAAAWPLAARAQQPAIPVVGFLSSGERGVLHQALAGFTDGLKETGYVEGQNVAVEYRFAEGQFDRFPALASDLVHRQVAVLVATSNSGAIAAKQATTSIPVVFSVGDDPVKTGLVGSLNRPEGNVTGVYQFTAGLEAKRLGHCMSWSPMPGPWPCSSTRNIRVSQLNCATCKRQRPAWVCN
jgi:putative ABC transport system substrate-binding protein